MKNLKASISFVFFLALFAGIVNSTHSYGQVPAGETSFNVTLNSNGTESSGTIEIKYTIGNLWPDIVLTDEFGRTYTFSNVVVECYPGIDDSKSSCCYFNSRINICIFGDGTVSGFFEGCCGSVNIS